MTDDTPRFTDITTHETRLVRAPAPRRAALDRAISRALDDANLDDRATFPAPRLDGVDRAAARLAGAVSDLDAPDAPFCDAPEGWTESAVWTGSGFLDVLDPDPDKIKLYEVALGLARQSRFGPALAETYTVAEHSIAAQRIMRAIACNRGRCESRRRDLECAALLHDAPEYVLRDLLGPVKRQCPDVRRLDGLLSRAVEARFRLPEGILDDPLVREVDKLATESEAARLLPEMPPWPGMGGGHIDGVFFSPDPVRAFIRAAHALGLF